MKIKCIFTAILLLLIGASRIFRLDTLGMNPDEIWSVWQTLGTPSQILQWTPYDWPPGYYLTLGLWRFMVGQNPIVLRYLSVLAFLLGSSLVFRIVKRLNGFNAAIIAMLAYAALGYGILLSTEVRGYSLLLGLLPLALWLTLRYFDNPSILRALLLALSLSLMFYISLTSIGAFLILGIFTLVGYRNKIWLWIPPGLVALILVAPEIISKSRIAIERIAATRTLTLPPIFEALRNLYWGYAGNELMFLIWIILFLISTYLILYHFRLNKKMIMWLLWAVGAPFLMYISHPVLAFFSLRYAWWIMLGIVVWVASGLAYLPRKGIAIVTVLLSVMMFVPIPLKDYTPLNTLSALETNLIWMKDHLTAGDVFIADPNMRCGASEEWDYFIRTYFPMGLTFVQEPGDFRRIWYVSADGNQDIQLHRSIIEGRIPGRFFGPPECLFRLYEGPPDRKGILFENGMRFHGAQLMEGERPWSAPIVRHEGEALRLRLWWSVDYKPNLDYSIGLYAMRAKSDNDLFAESNSPPQIVYPTDISQQTSYWKPGQFYIEERVLTLPYPTPKIDYRIALAVYYWQDLTRVAASGANNNKLLTLLYFDVMAY